MPSASTTGFLRCANASAGGCGHGSTAAAGVREPSSSTGPLVASAPRSGVRPGGYEGPGERGPFGPGGRPSAGL